MVNREAGVRFNGNFDLLRNIAGEGGADADVNLGFPLEELVEPENFLSLLYYFGLLSIRGESHGRTRLGIPNQTVRRLLYGYLRDGYRDVGVFAVSHYKFSNLVVDMAYRGAWRPALEFLGEAIAARGRRRHRRIVARIRRRHRTRRTRTSTRLSRTAR